MENEDDITVTTIRDVLRTGASDAEIAVFAEANDWVVFTNDTDIYSETGNFWRLFYSQIEDPSPGNSITAIQRIEWAYESNTDIEEVIPDEWV